MSSKANDELIHTLKRSNILLYVGEGASAAPLLAALTTDLMPGAHRIIPVTAWDLLNDSEVFHAAVLLIMPGGADLPYGAALNGRGNAMIRRFVEDGGVYLGICAGGYYGCGRIEFHKGSEDEICGPRELAFFAGVAIGSIREFGAAYDMTKRSASTPRLAMPDGGTCRAYYNGGAYFRGDGQAQMDVLARYADLAGAPPAIVEVPVGKGRAILTGVHPEISPGYLRRELADLTDGAAFAHLPQVLSETDAMRRTLWKDILTRCGLVPSPELKSTDDTFRNSLL